MFRLLLIWLFLAEALAATDYDCVFVGTSPVPLVEALCQSAAGKKVLVLERDSVCGGAWRTIDACGVAHVDMGCHHIGGNRALGEFLEKLGCKVVSMSKPETVYNPEDAPLGLYFSQGCYELISVLEARVRNSSIELQTGAALKNVTFEDEWAVLELSGGEFHRAKKIYHTVAASFSIEGKAPEERRSKFHHLYLLIADGGPIRCSYRGGFSGASRIMNLTSFAGLTTSNLQLFVLQVHNEEWFKKSADFIRTLKSSGLLEESGWLISEEAYTYEQAYCNGLTNHLPAEKKSFFEILDTSHFYSSMQRYLDRWNALIR